MPISIEKNPFIEIEGQKIGLDYPAYFIADIAANHDGQLSKAIDLIGLAKKAGADAVKFQHFRAEKIVSDYGFKSMGDQVSHQSKWSKSVFQVYKEASLPWEWTPDLKKESDRLGIHFFSAPYDLEAIEMLDQYVPAYKIGSGDIDWWESIEKMSLKKKPVLLATGAATMEEVKAAVDLILKKNSHLCVMQCNTNYTGSRDNFGHIHLNVLKTYSHIFPQTVLGLSDHTSGPATVLGAVALGARAIEKHFTSSRKNEGPDHAFSMEPGDWREMVDRTRELESALGSSEKKVSQNEQQTYLIQRRCCRAVRNIKAGEIISKNDIAVLRPVKPGAFRPPKIDQIIGRKSKVDIPAGEAFSPESIQ